MSLYAKAITASTSRLTDELMGSRLEVYFDGLPGKLGIQIAHPKGKMHVLELAKMLRAMAWKLEFDFEISKDLPDLSKDTRWRVKS